MKFNILAIFICSILLVAVKGNESRDGFVIIDGKQYYVATTAKLTWKQAMDSCNSVNMKLVSLLTQEKYNLIDNFMLTYTGGLDLMWTSGVRHNGVSYLWTGLGSDFTYALWDASASQPTGLPDENCISNRAGVGLHDNICTDVLSYMCEHPCSL